MTYFADLSRCAYFDREERRRLIAVGWLSDQEPYAKGPVSPEFVDKLFDLIETIWDPVQFRGYHECEFCGRGNFKMTDEKGRCARGIGHTNLFVPTGHPRWLFAAPSMILHYVVDHEYSPPETFQKAVLACPRTRDVEYFRTMEQLIPNEWHDRMNGFRAALGWTLARKAGSLDMHLLNGAFERALEMGMQMNRSDDFVTPAKFPTWFEQDYIAPMHALATALDTRGDASDARAVREWIGNLEFMGDVVPVAREDFLRALSTVKKDS